MKRKRLYIIVVAAFLIQICGHSLLFLFREVFQENETFSEQENRELAVFPEFSMKEYISGSFAAQFETYLDDHFPFKYNYVDVSRKVSSLYYFDGFSGEDDMVILTGSSIGHGQLNEWDNKSDMETENDMTEPPPLTDTSSTPEQPNATEPPAPLASAEEVDDSPPLSATGGLIILKDRLAESFTASDVHIDKYTEAVNKLYNECGKPDTYVILPPSAAQLYLPDKYRNDTNNQYTALDKLKAKLDGPKYIDLKDTFEKHKDEYLYFKTDHHWTAFGAYYAYEAFINESGMTPTKLSEYKTGSQSGFQGSLYKALAKYPQYESFRNIKDDVHYNIPKHNAEVFSYRSADLIDGEERQLIYPDYSRNTNLYNIFMGGDVPLGYIHSDVGNGKSILVVRDSYGHAFLPYLVDNFEYIYSVEPRYFDKTANIIKLGDFFQEKQIDTLLFMSYSIPSTSNYWRVLGDELQIIAE